MFGFIVAIWLLCCLGGILFVGDAIVRVILRIRSRRALLVRMERMGLYARR
jgi:hypothetical protein